MKSLILSCLFLIIAVNLFAQQTPTLTKLDYLQKSKAQKSAAWVMLGGGIATMVAGASISLQDIFSNNATGPVLFSVGLLSSLGSIPLFIAASRNKIIAASLSFKNEKLPLHGNTNLARNSMPTLSLRIDL
ncbi:MAG: hypothetical protein ACXVLT_05290 [Flavisolibacter sp.]